MRLPLVADAGQISLWIGGPIILLAFVVVVGYIFDIRGFRGGLRRLAVALPWFSIETEAMDSDSSDVDMSLVAPGTTGPPNPPIIEVQAKERSHNIFGALSRTDRQIGRLLVAGRFAIKKREPAVLVNALIRCVLRNLEDVLEQLVPDATVFAIVKAPDPGNPSELRCYYSDHEDGRRSGTHHQDINDQLVPVSVDRADSIVGHLLSTAQPRPLYIRDIEEHLDDHALYRASLLKLREMGAESLVAFPIRYNEETVAALWVDCDRKYGIAESAVLTSVLRNFVEKVSLIFSIAERDAALEHSRTAARKNAGQLVPDPPDESNGQ